MSEIDKKYELVYESLVNNTIPVKKFKSKATNITVAFADVGGPLVNGYFCLSTEASDDDGLPHTLEHLIFLGSENHPYKGVLDKVATRSLSDGTNAWTDVDHTCYTITTAGSTGFLNLLPIYLDHILYPILSNAAYITEVHHITEEGKDAGVVYSEMQSVENTGSNKVYLEARRNIYPPDSGYRFETGGILENIRTSTNNEKVRDYHKKFYRPENLCLIVTGKIDHQQFFQTLSEFENKILSKGIVPNFDRPWMKSTMPLERSVIKTVKFPSDDDEEGEVMVAWRGPNINDQLNMLACMITMEYLTDSPVALLNQTFVEIDKPFCGEVDYTIVENKESLFSIEFESVSMDTIKQIQPKLMQLLEDLSKGILKFDMERMRIVIRNKIVEITSQLEDDPHETISSVFIGDFLYGLSNDDLEARLQQIDILNKLLLEEETFWQNFLLVFVTSKPNVTIIGEPSPDEVKKNSAAEESRVERRKTELGKSGLDEKKKDVNNAIEENNRSTPEEFLMNLKIPNTKNLHYHPITSYTNSPQFQSLGAIQSSDGLEKIPCHFQLDDIDTNFIKICLCLDIQNLPASLIAYLPLYVEVLFESPVIRNGVVIPYEVVVQELNRDLVEYTSSLGVLGSRFQPGEFSPTILISLKVKMDQFETGVKWCGELLGAINFTPERVSAVAKKMLSDIKQLRREADVVVEAVAVSSIFNEGSVPQASSFLAQQHFLKDCQSNKKAKKHLPKLMEIQQYLMNLNNIYIHMATNINKLKSTLEGKLISDVWIEHFTSVFKDVTKEHTSNSKWSLKKDDTFTNDISKLKSCIVGLGSTDSAYMVKVSPCINDFNHPDVPALLVFCHFVSFLEGPMWRLIRGKGLAYSFSLVPDINEGLLYFKIEQSSDPCEAYKQAIGLIESILSGITQISQLEMECAKCQCIYELIQSIQTPSMASKQTFSCFMRNIPLDYYNGLLDKVQNVKMDELLLIAEKYISKLISPKTSAMFVACNTKDMTRLLDQYQTMCQSKFLVFKKVDDISIKK